MLVKHFESLSRLASDIIIVADETGQIVEANERAVENYGYAREELLRMNVSDLRLANEDPAILRKQIEVLNRQGELHYEAVDRRKDGTIFFVEVSARVIEVQGVRYLQGIVRDITVRKRAQEALRKSEALLSSSQRMARIGSWELDLSNDRLLWSEENYRIFEADPARFGGNYEAFINAVHPEDRAKVEEAYFSAVKNRTSYEIEHRLLLPNQRVKYLREWCETEYDADGKPVRSIGTTQDVTEQQLAKQRIQRLNNFYAAVSKADEAIVRTEDRDTLLDAICRIAVKYGQFKLAWIGLADEPSRQLRIVASSGEAKDYLESIQAAIDADLPEGIGPAYIAFRENREIVCNDFFSTLHVFPWQENARKFGLYASASCPFTLDGNVIGALTLYAGEAKYFDQELSRLLGDLANDISLALANFDREKQRRQAEEMLRKSAREIEDLYNNAPCGYHSVNEYGIIIQINDTELHWLGYSRDEVLGKMNIANLYHLKDKQKFLTKVTQFDRNWFVRDSEIELIRKDGSLLPVIQKATAICDDAGNFVATRTTLYDNTERKLVENLREEMEQIGRLNVAAEMASGMAHELSQPLTACSNYLDGCLRRMKEDNWDQEQIRKVTQLAYKQSERAGKIINHLKGLVRKNDRERVLTDVNALVGETLLFLENEINNQEISVHLDLSDLPLVMVSRVEIGQIILNLCKNAIEAMRDTAQRELRVATRIDENGQVLVVVTDTGTGISAVESEHLFSPFHTSKQEGLGLGLSICRSFVEKHGGRIWVNQHRETGAEFCFSLPTGIQYEEKFRTANSVRG
ncbi:MAG TPA: PAS domain S-box protein [Gallionella sp.]|nr:PAS domain S-box protein [Gallionella sp.]